MQQRKATPKPFQNSLSALAQVAARETGADGYALFRKGPEGRGLVRHDSGGADIREEAVTGHTSGLVVYRLGADGVLAFAFQDESRSRQVGAELDRIVTSIEAVWTAAQTAGRYSELASEVAELEVRLMDSKIADRVRGFLTNRGETSPADAISRHVEGVLKPASTGRVLEQLSKDLEEEVEERRVTNRAKAILQTVHGMSEEQAHMHLRQTSRKTRKKLKDVAAEIIGSDPVRETARST
jgi:hypothetical protein